MPKDKFILLSAYLDGETTPQETAQVQLWLRSEPEFYQLYQQQLRLRQALRSLPVPQAMPPETMAKQVLFRLEYAQRQKFLSIGGAVAVVMAVAGVFLAISSSHRSTPEITPVMVQSVSPTPQEEPLMIALETPIVPLPNALGQ
ncbi:MAG: anti-sigma factor family protein [Pseudanabaenaceae cyanobacterium]